MKRIALAIAVLAALATAGRADDAKDGWIQLFNGKDLAGWKANEKPEQWKVENGAIVAHGDRSHLFYIGTDPSNPPSSRTFTSRPR